MNQGGGEGAILFYFNLFAVLRIPNATLFICNGNTGYKPDVFMDYAASRKIGLSQFVHRELIQFSLSSVVRAIPSIIDGLKPSQRKVLYACFKRKLTQEIKVAQLAGYVSEHAAYHHGEVSLQECIIKLANNYVGSNNVNYLYPSGQFGTRLMGGKDAASSRYIFTRLEAVTRAIFPVADDPVLDYLEDDGQMVEPRFYVPIIPTILVNGADGIGTGWSTSLPNHSPRAVIDLMRSYINNSESKPSVVPWYR